MVVSRKRLKAQPPALVLLSSPIDRVDSIDYLGLRIQCDLSWTDHIRNICSKARRLVGMLFRQFYHCAESSTIRTLYLTLIRPHLEYASDVWDPYLIKDCKLLEDVQKFDCKVCLKCWDTDYDEMLTELKIPRLDARRKALKLCILYKILNNPSTFPTAPLGYRYCPYTTRSTHSQQLCNLNGHTAQI